VNEDTVNVILRIVASTAKLAVDAQANHAAAIELAKQAEIPLERISKATALYTQPVIDPLREL